MNRLLTLLFLIACLGLSSCAQPNLAYPDLKPATHATLSGDALTIHLGTNWANSAWFTHVRTKVRGQTAYLSARHSIIERKHEFTLRLPATVKASTVAVVWVNPDGSHVPVPLTGNR